MFWRQHENILTRRTCRSSWSATAARSNRKPRSSANSKCTTRRASDCKSGRLLCYCFIDVLTALYVRYAAADAGKLASLFSFSFCCLLGSNFLHYEETAAGTGESEYCDFSRAATGAGNRSGNRRENSQDAEVIRRVQERRRSAGDTRHRQKAAR